MIPPGLDLPRPPEWMQRALCAEIGGDEWFPEKGCNGTAAKRICQRCPVQQECRDYAEEHRIADGIWGGVAEKARTRSWDPTHIVRPSTEEDILRRSALGQPLDEIAAATGVTERTVGRVVSGARRRAMREAS